MKTGRTPILRNAIAAHLADGPKTIRALSQGTGRTRGAVYSTLSIMEQLRIVRRIGVDVEASKRRGGNAPYIFELARKAA